MKEHFLKLSSQVRRSFVYPFLFFVALLTAGVAAAWTGPLSTAPACTSGNPGCDAPLNISATAQSKAGGLLVNTGGATNGLIVQTGNVGIGTVSPAAKLHVVGNGYLQGNLNVVGPSDNWAQYINWPPDSSKGYGILVGTGPGKYSQFQNAEGYQTLLAQGSWGVNTNGNINVGGSINTGSTVNVGGAAVYTNGDMYLPYVGAYASGTYCRNSGANCPASGAGTGSSYWSRTAQGAVNTVGCDFPGHVESITIWSWGSPGGCSGNNCTGITVYCRY